MRLISACVLSLCLTVALNRVACAVVIAGDYTNSSDAYVNTSPPADDFGFRNVGAVGTASAIYLGTDGQGDGWVLSAGHVTLGPTTFTFPDASNPNQLDTATYSIVNNSGVVLTNTSGAGAGHNSDLILYKIDPSSSQYGLPNLPRLNIGTATPATGDTVIGVGRGVDRAATVTNWDANWNTTSQPNPAFTGYTLNSMHTMRWGDNNVAMTGVDVNVGTTANPVYVNSFWTQFNQNGTANEFQATSGDSGGGVFQNVGGQWYLTGMIDAVTKVSAMQPTTDVIFGASTIIADLSVYQNQIRAIVPEPGSLALVAAGTLAWLSGYVIRRRAR